jgi:ATP-binding cassette subfamily B protein
MARVQEVLDERPEVADAPSVAPLPPLRDELRFEGVTFSYPGQPPSLDGVDLSVRAGEAVAIVGPSGSGKSTLLGLLLRFYDPSAGRVLVDGRDLRDVSQASLRGQIGTVFQESFLFDTTIRENVRVGNPAATDREVEAAAAAAEIDAFVRALPDGYETRVGERGGRLSGGQRQRVAIARALVRDPPLLVLDEATSALDPATEAALNETLRRIRAGRTVVSVTHRLASVAHMDRVVVMARGRVAEQGTHAELLARDGLYAGLWRRQSGFTVSPDGQQARIDAERLRAIPLFADLDPAHLAAIADRFVAERRAAGEVIFHEGDPGDSLYVLARGVVEVVRRAAPSEEVPEQLLALLDDGDFFGEIALLSQKPRTATVRTRSPSLLLKLDRDQFTHLVTTDPTLAHRFEAAAEARLNADAARGQR